MVLGNVRDIMEQQNLRYFLHGVGAHCCMQDTTQVELVADKLDLSPYCSTAAKKQAQKPVYNLTAVTNHSGSMAGGHYTAQCKSALDDKWYDCNDSSVREDRGVEGPSSSAYVLFFRRQD